MTTTAQTRQPDPDLLNAFIGQMVVDLGGDGLAPDSSSSATVSASTAPWPMARPSPLRASPTAPACPPPTCVPGSRTRLRAGTSRTRPTEAPTRTR